MLPYWILFIVFAVGAMAFAPGMTVRQAAVPSAVRPRADHRPPSHWWESLGERSSLLPLAALLPLLMIGLRYRVGTDWNAYVEIFSRVEGRDFLSALTTSDPGYAFLNWLAETAGTGIWLVNLICALLFTFGLVRFVRAQPNPWLAMLVAIPYLVIVVGMGYSRQAVAIGLCMSGLVSLSRGSFFRFMLWTLAAALFHRSAVILIPIVGVAYSRDNFHRSVIALVALAVSYYVLTRGDAIEHFQSIYIRHVYESQGAGIRLAMNLPPALILLLSPSRFTANETERRVWRNFAILAVLSCLVWTISHSTTALDRMSLYIIPLQLFVLSRVPNVFGNGERPATGLVLFIIAYSAVVQFVWLNFANNAANWIPYRLYPTDTHSRE